MKKIKMLTTIGLITLFSQSLFASDIVACSNGRGTLTLRTEFVKTLSKPTGEPLEALTNNNEERSFFVTGYTMIQEDQYGGKVFYVSGTVGRGVNQEYLICQK